MRQSDEKIGSLDVAYFKGRKELLEFLNSTLSLKLTKLEQTRSGAVACQMVSLIYGTLDSGLCMRRANWSPINDYESLQNYRLLLNAFDKLGLEHEIDVDKLNQGSQTNTLEFCQWLDGLYHHHNTTIPDDYDAVAVRARGKGGAKFNKKHSQIAMLRENLLQKVDDHHENEEQGDQARLKQELLNTIDDYWKELDENLKEEKEQLDKVKEAIVQNVDEHLIGQDQKQQDDKDKAVATFKQELVDQVEDHLEEIHKQQEKKKMVDTLRQSLLQKVKEHEDHLLQVDLKQGSKGGDDSQWVLFQLELLAVVDEHCAERHAPEHVEVFKDNISEQVQEHLDQMATHSDKEQAMSSLTESLTTQDFAKFFNHHKWISPY